MDFDPLGERRKAGDRAFEEQYERRDEPDPKRELAKVEQPEKGGPGPRGQVSGLGPGPAAASSSKAAGAPCGLITVSALAPPWLKPWRP